MLITNSGGCNVKRVLDSGGNAAVWAHPSPAKATTVGCFFRATTAVRAIIKHALADVLVSAHSLASDWPELPSDSRVYSSSLKCRACQSKVFLLNSLFDTPTWFVTEATA